uniref:NADH-ubiquinone oxidoreductase chain 3 n=1 Tax=Ptilodactylidae sp. 2 ACP-2013 TaxID=1434563 RepID=A0A3G3FX30_9COLE|nr:NADH dehydrogenase subunit 3 [Ptilodactylidae sp. 2 ACP-2013]
MMFTISFMALIIFLITFLIMVIANILSKKTFKDREKSSPFECGFDPTSSGRLPFSLQFFIIAVIFLIFDIEIALLMPMIFTMKISNLLNFTLTLSIFIVIMLWGLYHEWHQGALSWPS